jgi:signal transduction histidine kinase
LKIINHNKNKTKTEIYRNIPVGKDFIVSFIIFVLIALSLLLMFSNFLLTSKINEETIDYSNNIIITELTEKSLYLKTIENRLLKLMTYYKNDIDSLQKELINLKNEHQFYFLDIINHKDFRNKNFNHFQKLLEKCSTGYIISSSELYDERISRVIAIPLNKQSILLAIIPLEGTSMVQGSLDAEPTGIKGIPDSYKLRRIKTKTGLLKKKLSEKRSYYGYLNISGQEFTGTAKALKNFNDETIGAIIAGISPSKYTPIKSESIKIITLTLILTFLIMFGFAFLSHKNLQHSVKSINKGIKEAKKGNLDFQIDHTPEKICSSIAENLNDMFKAIKKRDYEIIAYQDELRSKKDNLEAIFNSSTDGIITLTSDLKIINVNPTITQWAGASSEKIVGHHFNEFVKCRCNIKMSDIDCTDPSVCPIAAYWPEEMPKEGTITNKQSGKTTFVALNSSIIHGLTKSKESFVTVLMDITQFKELEKVKENFVATLTHDLRVPLLAENNALKYLLKGTYGDLTETQKLAAETMLKSNQDLIKLVNTLLDVYKYESGTLQLYKEKTSLNNLLKECINELYPLAAKHYQSIINNTKEILAPVTVDINEIKRVFINLIGNAITYTQENGTIQIESEQNEENVIIKVIDNGKGIPENDLKNIFDRYFTSSKKFRKVGTGLGLYLSKQIILAHNGKIWVESTPGKGSTFFVSLPINIEESS